MAKKRWIKSAKQEVPKDKGKPVKDKPKGPQDIRKALYHS